MARTARRKKHLKRMRDRLRTQRFFALPPDDVDDDDDDESTSTDSDSDSTGKASPPCGHAAGAGSRDLIGMDCLDKDTVAKYQKEQARLTEAGGDRQRNESSPPCNYLEVREKAKMLSIWGAEVTRDRALSTPTRVEARCSYVLARAWYMQEELDSMLSCVQALNADKPAYLAEEQYSHIKDQRAARHGKPQHQPVPDSSTLGLASSESSKAKQIYKPNSKGKQKRVPPKDAAIGVILTTFQQNLSTAVLDVQEFCQNFSTQTLKLPLHPPEDLTFCSFKLPPGLPPDIRQEIQNLEFALSEIYPVRKNIKKMFNEAKAAISNHFCYSLDTYVPGKQHVFVSRKMAVYEQTRRWLGACYILWRRGEDKVHRFVSENELGGVFGEDLSKALGITLTDADLRADDWRPMLEVMKTEAPPLTAYLEVCEEARRTWFGS
ncbi:hypothetical protein MMC16_007291 [Acarospora aff. strigata]|nr:hypothetical protein [Acarospora aff. strigata]